MTGNRVVGEVKREGGGVGGVRGGLGPAGLQPALSSTLSMRAGSLIH